ncbi:hypothetical protein AB0I28_32735 [Phytomonospora sp. NPDC050363]|uniref:hypothetical protein n=1 Tax=Phytomonospora sp. NPDC050363 TaxID=3155642 RepID=UPI0033DDA735
MTTLPDLDVTDYDDEDDVKVKPDADDLSPWRQFLARHVYPSIFSASYAPVPDLVNYARNQPWTGEYAVSRNLGKGYVYGVAIPLTLLFVTLTWIIARPGRLFTALAVGLLFTITVISDLSS